MFMFIVYEPVFNKFIVNTCYYPPPLFTFSELTTAMREIIFTENQHAIRFLEFSSKN